MIPGIIKALMVYSIIAFILMMALILIILKDDAK